MKNETPKVIDIKVLPDYYLDVHFADGQERLFDVKPYLDKGVFKALKDPNMFQAVKAHSYYVEWPGEIDLSADTLYIKGQTVANANKKVST